LANALVGSGVAVVDSREVESFDSVDIDGAIHALIKVGKLLSIEVKGDDNVVPLVVTKVVDGELEIYLDHDGPVRMQDSIRVVATTPSLDELDVSGACQVTATGVDAESFDVDLSGAANLVMSGTCHQLHADVSGAAKLDTADLRATDVSVDCSGAANAVVWASETVEGDASGAAKIEYSGNPTKVAVELSGMGTLTRADAEPEA
jgi:hypothetical protein